MALAFCPDCGTHLQMELGVNGTQLWCPLCSYRYEVTGKMSVKLPLQPKPVDDILSKEAQWANAQKTEAKCGRCGGGEAFFLEVQTRSADEPASLFFRCTACGHRWREG